MANIKSNKCPGNRLNVRLPALGSLAVICLLSGGASAFAGDKLPSGEEILERYIEVTGGRAAYEKFHNEVIKSKLDMAEMGMTASMTVYSAEPNKFYSVVEAEAFGRIEEGYNGDIAWQTNPMMGPRIKEGKEKLMAQRQGVFNAELNWRKIYKKVECVGVETEGDQELYKVVMTPIQGDPETRFYDKKTGLLARREMTMESQMGEINLKISADDYKKVDGVLIPHKMAQDMGVQKVAFIIESIEHNVDLPKDRFDVPAEIKELIAEAEKDKEKEKESN